MTNTTLSVVIPCYPPHAKYLLFLLEELNNQTRKPDEILIGYSELTNEQGEALQVKLQSLTKIPLQVISTHEKARASVNRNNATLYASGTHIVYLDADDSYSPQLLETIARVVTERDPDALMYCFGDEREPIPEVLPIIESATLFENTWPKQVRDRFEEMSYNSCPMIKAGKLSHDRYGGLHGHIVLKRSIWEEMPQPDVPGREDAIYCRDILWRWHIEGRKSSGFLLLYFPLVKYRYHEKLISTTKSLNQQPQNGCDTVRDSSQTAEA